MKPLPSNRVLAIEMARASDIALKRIKVLLLGIDAQVRKCKRHFHASQHVLQAILFFLKPIEIQLAEQANGNDLPVKGLLCLFGKEFGYIPS